MYITIYKIIYKYYQFYADIDTILQACSIKTNEKVAIKIMTSI